MRRVRRDRIESGADRISALPTSGGLITFSYLFYARTRKFEISDCTATWFEALLDWMRSISSLRPQEVLSNRSNALRAHPIDFSRTSEPKGFDHLNPQLRGYPPYQFQLSKERGRVHGFFIDLVFYVVWLDPHHRLYP